MDINTKDMIDRRRNILGVMGTSPIDWESIARGLLDGSLSGDVVLPDDISSLRVYAFANISNITSIVANGVGSVGAYAFSNMTNLETIAIGTINDLGANAFNNCRKLSTPIILGDNVTTLGGGTFFNCYKIPYVDAGVGVTSIGAQCFRYMTNCQYIIMRATTPPTLAANNFVNSSTATYPIYVPDASVNDYKAASDWSTFASRIKPISELGGVADNQPLSGCFFMERRAAA